LRVRFPPWNRGWCARISPLANARSADQALLSSPRDSTPYAVTPMPSSRQVGRISSSIPRETSEYSICTSLIG
jgi:hypothetical protein